MGRFEATLRREVDGVQTLLTVASQVGDTGGFVRHRARLLDLLAVATRSEVDTAGWVDSAVRSLLCGD